MLRRRRIVVAAAAALAIGALGASLAPAQILNSERIEQTFGSYGVEVLFNGDGLRLSNLYSDDGSGRVMRTFAIVSLPSRIEPVFATEHRAILDGGSIGATLQAAGWRVIKRNLVIDAGPVPPALAERMGIDASSEVAAHAYRLEIERDGQRYDYATLIELHHPDYLSRAQLAAIYTDVEVPDESDMHRLRQLRSEGLRRLAALGSALSE